MSENKLTQLYDKNGNELFPNIPLKTINGKSILAEGSPIEDDDYEQKNNIIITTTQSKMKIVYVYKVTEEQPDKPSGGSIAENGVFNPPNGWFTEDLIDKNTEGNLWRSYATLIFGASEDDSEWSNPSLINEVDAGADGKDGTDIKLIYCLTKEFKAPDAPFNYTGDTFVDGSAKGDWREDAMGVDNVWKYEWVSMSIKESGYNNTFGAFSTPTLWAKWSDDGKDGAGIEYVYRRTNDNSAPEIEYTVEDPSYQTPNFLPNNWDDDYESPTYDNRYSWVAIRHFKDGSWGGFSQPKLWNIYKVAGKSYVDLYKRSDIVLGNKDLPDYEGNIYYLFSNDKFYKDENKSEEIFNIGNWDTNIVEEGGNYLYKTQAYVDIVDTNELVSIDKSQWCGPYLVSYYGKDGENAIAESAYLQLDNDSFSLPITESGKTHIGVDYNDFFNVKLMYGDDEIVIDSSKKIVYNEDLFETFDASIKDDNKTLSISFKIKNNIDFKQVEAITITLNGIYNEKEYTATKTFRIIPYISNISEFYKIRINDDTIYIPSNVAEDNGIEWNHEIIVNVVDNRGNTIDVADISCYLAYFDNKENVEVSNNIKIDAKGENGYINYKNLPNPLEIRLIDKETEIVREIEYIDFINLPKDGADGTDGADGANGANGADGISSRMVFAYCSSEQQPATPEGGSVDFDTNVITYPKEGGWGDNADLEGIVWLSNREFFSDNTADPMWTTPMRITGPDGKPGEDGTNIEFAYHLFKSEKEFNDNKINKPEGEVTSTPTDIKQDEKWTDNPQGIDSTYIIEACSQRVTKSNGEWGDWSTPFIWSKWGEDGTDGDGVEYIYKIGSKTGDNVDTMLPPIENTDYYETYKDIIQQDDFVPNESWLKKYATDNGKEYATISVLNTGWSDQPSDVSDEEPVEWVSIRKKKNGVWQPYSSPVIWNEWHRDGYDTFTEFLFTSIPSNDKLDGYKVVGGTYEKPTEELKTINVEDETDIKENIKWSDTLPTYKDGYSIWMISSFFSSNKNGEYYNGKWTAPSKMTDSQTLQVEYSNTSEIDSVNITQLSTITNYTSLEDLESQFRASELKRNVTWGDENISNPIWMATSRLINGAWSKWVVTKIKGEKGDTGAKGDPGTSVQFKGSFNSVDQLEAAYEYYLNKDGNPPSPYFTDNELNSGDGYLINGNLYVYDGSKEEFKKAWVNVGQIKGDKGDSFYLYIAYSNDGGKTFTERSSEDTPYGLIPGKYIGTFVSNAKMETNFPSSNDQCDFFTWNKWQGDDGFGQEQIFILKDSSILKVPSTEGYEPEEWNAQDFKPNDWEDTPLTPTINKPYCLMVTRRYPATVYDSSGYNLFKGDKSGNAIVFSYLAKDGSDGSNGIDGTSPFHIELSNEYDQVYVTDNVVMTKQDVSTYITIYKGSENVSKQVKITCSDGSVSYDINTESYKLIKSFNENYIIDTNEVSIDINVAKNDSIGLSYPTKHTFKIIKLNGTIDYDLKVTPTYIKVDSSGNCSSDVIEVSLLKSSIGTNNRQVEETKTIPTNYSIKYTTNGIDDSSQPIINLNVPITVNSSDNYYTIYLYNNEESKIIDRVNVELLKDGKDGKDGKDAQSVYHIELSNEFDLLETVDKKVKTNQDFTTTVKLYEGNIQIPFYDIDIQTNNDNNIDTSVVWGTKYTNEKGDQETVIINGESKKLYLDASIIITINKNNYKEYNTPIVLPIIVNFDSQYDNDNNEEEVSSGMVIKPITSTDLYQLSVTPLFVVNDGEKAEKQIVKAKIYKKDNNGIEFLSNGNIPTDISIGYLFNNDVSTQISITDFSGYDDNNGINVFTYDSSNMTYKDISINEIDVRLYKNGYLYDNVNVEVKKNLKPAAIFDITPIEQIVYLDASKNIIPKTIEFETSFSFEGRRINPNDCSIVIKDSSDYEVSHLTVSKTYTKIKVDVKNEKNKTFNDNSVITYYFEIKYDGYTYQKPFSILYANSDLTISSLFDTFNISRYKKDYYKDGDDTISQIFDFDVYFNGENVTQKCEITINTTALDSSMKQYIKDEGLSFNYRVSGWYIMFKVYDPSTNKYDIFNFIEDNKEPKITFTFTYNGISVDKEWSITDTGINEELYSIKCSPQTINTNDNVPIEMYIGKSISDYVTLKNLEEKGYKFLYKIDDGEEIDYIGKTNKPLSRGNYAFYPNGCIIYDADGETELYSQEPIYKQIEFILKDENDKLVTCECVERLDIAKNTYVFNVGIEEEGIDLKELFNGETYLEGDIIDIIN